MKRKGLQASMVRNRAMAVLSRSRLLTLAGCGGDTPDAGRHRIDRTVVR